jgi:hypothetical protein
MTFGGVRSARDYPKPQIVDIWGMPYGGESLHIPSVRTSLCHSAPYAAGARVRLMISGHRVAHRASRDMCTRESLNMRYSLLMFVAIMFTLVKGRKGGVTDGCAKEMYHEFLAIEHLCVAKAEKSSRHADVQRDARVRRALKVTPAVPSWCVHPTAAAAAPLAAEDAVYKKSDQLRWKRSDFEFALTCPPTRVYWTGTKLVCSCGWSVSDGMGLCQHVQLCFFLAARDPKGTMALIAEKLMGSDVVKAGYYDPCWLVDACSAATDAVDAAAEESAVAASVIPVSAISNAANWSGRAGGAGTARAALSPRRAPSQRKMQPRRAPVVERIRKKCSDIVKAAFGGGSSVAAAPTPAPTHGEEPVLTLVVTVSSCVYTWRRR